MTKLKTTMIKNKPYVEVNTRIKYFRESDDYKDWALLSEFVEINEKYCIIKGSVLNPEGIVKATGFAREVNGDSFINKTSYVENCETSAWGRALGNLGIGIDTGVASYEEVQNAINNQGVKITPHGEDTTQAYLDDVERKLNDCHTMGQLEACKKDLTKTYNYFKNKIKDENAVKKFKVMVEDKTEQLRGEK